jgi:16S rRNA (cytosine967-C5)-methyltransferase
MSASAARQAALQAVTRVRERQAYAHETMAATLKDTGLSPRDVAFATRLAYGTIACRGTLDEAIAGFVDAKHPLEVAVADALAVTAYELLFMRTPPRAAVSEGVELVRSQQPKASRLANAVLRRLADKVADFPWGDPLTDVAALARLYGHPTWMARLFVDELGLETAQAVMAADNEPAPLFLAHMPHSGAFETAMDDLERSGAEPRACPLSGCIQALAPGAAVRSKALSSREVVVADAAAQLAAACVRPRAGDKIVEIGAGRGTKTLIMSGIARLDGSRAQLLAVDTHEFKLEALRKAAADLGAAEIGTLVADATQDGGELSVRGVDADSVLVDAPCSGLGTLRRHPDRRWRAREDDIPALADLGGALLRRSATLVRPGGFVVYSTCTITRAENEDVARRFLASEEGKGFSIDPLTDDVPAAWLGFLRPEGWFRSLPSAGGMDGHFIVRFKRA